MTRYSKEQIESLLEGTTPGPWRVLYDKDLDDEDEVHSIVHVNVDGWASRIVETDAGHYPPERYDAELIAAAPDLARQLVDTLDYLDAKRRQLEELQAAHARAVRRLSRLGDAARYVLTQYRSAELMAALAEE